MAVMLWLILSVLLSVSYASALPRKVGSNENLITSDSRAANIITAQGYIAETHHVVTEDGYNLTMHRIPYGYEEVNVVPALAEKPVVFLMHGLSVASHAFLMLGRERSTAYFLADAGFDVWMGNARGNVYSRAHVTLDPDDVTERFPFFDFSWDEIGIYDLPAMVDYVLEVTGKESLHYIGHSQGGTTFLVLNSVRPEYNAKFSSAHLLAGVGYMEHFPDEELAGLAQNVDMLYNLALLMGLVELVPVVQVNSSSSMSQCLADPALEHMCDVLQRHSFMSFDDGVDNPSLEDIFAGMGGSGGASIKQYAHYGQNIQTQLFRRWSYGTAGNLAAYGTEEPPLYNIGLITVNTTMHYAMSDELQDERDVLSMAADMPNCLPRRVARDSFSHGDFISAVDARELVIDYIIEQITEYENNLDAASNVEEQGNGNEVVDAGSNTPTEEIAAVDQSNSASRTSFAVSLLSILVLSLGVCSN